MPFERAAYKAIRQAFGAQEPQTVEEFFAAMPRIETQRLILRKVSMRDAEDVFAYASDPQVAKYVLWNAHKSMLETKSYIRFLMHQYRDAVPGNYVIVWKQTGQVVGTIGYMAYEREDSCVEIGYSIGRRWWNMGITTEAFAALIRHTFLEMHIHRIEARHDTENPASGRVMQKCGLRPEGVQRGKVFNKGSYRDVAMWAILREDYLR